MRTPTPHDQAYAWHSRAIRGEKVSIHEGDPQCGFFLAKSDTRLRYVPASIYLEQSIDPDTGELMADEVIRAEVMGEVQEDAGDAWLHLARRPICRLFYQQKLAESF
jgi:hypothetical protein